MLTTLVVFGTILIVILALAPRMLLESIGYMLAYKPYDYEGWYYYGSLLVKRKRMVDAEYALKRAVAIRPDLSKAWLLLSEIYEKMGLHDASAEALDLGRMD